MAAEGGCIDFMFLGPPLPSRWIRYWISSVGSLVHLHGWEFGLEMYCTMQQSNKHRSVTCLNYLNLTRDLLLFLESQFICAVCN